MGPAVTVLYLTDDMCGMWEVETEADLEVE